MMEDLESAGGSHVRATVVRGGGAVLAAAPKNPNDRGFYSVQAHLLGGVEVTVYVPDSVSLTDGASIEVVEGRYGHYFRSVASPR
jgi:ribosomal protein S12